MGSTLGNVVRDRRRELGLTQEELAERISTETELVHQADISRIETGRVGMPRFGRLVRIASALQMSIEDLLRGAGLTEEEPPSPTPAGKTGAGPATTSLAANLPTRPSVEATGLATVTHVVEPSDESAREFGNVWLAPGYCGLRSRAEETRTILQRNQTTIRSARAILNRHVG